MNDTALIFGLRKHFVCCFKHAQVLLSNNEFHAVKTASAQPLEELNPDGFVFFHTFCCAKNFPVPVFIDCNSNKNGYILVLTAPAPFQIDTVYI